MHKQQLPSNELTTNYRIHIHILPSQSLINCLLLQGLLVPTISLKFTDYFSTDRPTNQD